MAPADERWAAAKRREARRQARQASTNNRGGSAPKKRFSAVSTAATPRRVIPMASRRQPSGSPPPVMARSSSTGMPGRDGRHSQAARRRFDVALPASGAEIRLPSMPRFQLGWRLVSFILAVALAAVIYYAWTSPTYLVKEAEIGGLQRLNATDVKAVLGVTGKPVFTLNPKELSGNLQAAFPEFSAVSVQIGLPATVAVTVTERIPVLTWRQGGVTELVDSEGMAFPLRGSGEGPSPLVEASATPPNERAIVISEETIHNMIYDITPTPTPLPTSKEAPAAPAGARPLLSPTMVSAILSMAARAPQGMPLVYDQNHGLGWQDGRGWVVYFGDDQDMDQKLKVYAAVLDKLQKEGSVPLLISVEHLHAPYYRLEK